MAGIEAKNYSLSYILKDAHYQIEYYQREYAWEEREVGELLDDLVLKFRESYNPADKSTSVSTYKEYFLGSIVVADKVGEEKTGDNSIASYIVDGQQRLTTLVLLFSYIYKRLKIADAKRYVSSTQYGKEEYNIYVKERIPVMDYIFSDDKKEPSSFVAEHKMNHNYNYIQEYFELLEIDDKELEYFYYWLEHQVLMIKITVDGSEEAYTIFESMNDRGRPLTDSEMLKGYILSLIEEKRQEASELWGSISKKFKTNKDFDEFLILLFRARYAVTTPKSVGVKEKNRNNHRTNDYAYIGKSYYKFIKENKNDLIGILDQDDAYNFLKDLDYYSDLYFKISEKEKSLQPGYEGIYYISRVLPPDFYLLFLGAILANDEQEEEKIKVISKFLDIRSGLFAWNLANLSSNINLSTYIISLLQEIREIEDKDVLILISVLYNEIIKTRGPETGWRNFSEKTAPSLSENHNRKKNIRYILSRVTELLEVESERVSLFSEMYSKKYEIEHVLAADYAVNDAQFSSQDELDMYRDKIGALGVLEKSINASLGDKPYNYKVKKYVLNNMYLATLNSSLYNGPKEKIVNIPGLVRLTEKHPILKDLIKPYAEFGKDEILERNKLITELSKIIWNPNDFQHFLDDYKYDIEIQDLGDFVGVEINHENVPLDDALEVDNKYGFPIDSKWYFQLEDSLCEFTYVGKRKINLSKIKNGTLLKTPEKVFKGSNNIMLEIYNEVIKNAIIKDNNTYDWEGTVENVIMLAPVYLVTGKNHVVQKSGIITIKKDYHPLQ